MPPATTQAARTRTAGRQIRVAVYIRSDAPGDSPIRAIKRFAPWLVTMALTRATFSFGSWAEPRGLEPLTPTLPGAISHFRMMCALVTCRAVGRGARDSPLSPVADRRIWHGSGTVPGPFAKVVIVPVGRHAITPRRAAPGRRPDPSPVAGPRWPSPIPAPSTPAHGCSQPRTPPRAGICRSAVRSATHPCAADADPARRAALPGSSSLAVGQPWRPLAAHNR
jgi:hypothetical protein